MRLIDPIQFPVALFDDKRIGTKEGLVYSLILNMAIGEDGVTLTNDEMAENANVDPKKIIGILSNLYGFGYIRIEVVFDSNFSGYVRKIYPLKHLDELKAF